MAAVVGHNLILVHPPNIIMLTLRRTTPGIRQISNSLSLEIKFLSSTSRNVTASTTSDGVAPRRLKIYETEKVVKYVHVSQPNPIQKLTGNTDPKEGNTNYIANPVGRFYQQAVHKGRQVCKYYEQFTIIAKVVDTDMIISWMEINLVHYRTTGKQNWFSGSQENVYDLRKA